MNRRFFLALGAALALAPAARGETLHYTPGMVEDLVQDGRTVIVGFWADWCPSCRVQERMINQFRGENPAYDAHITFVRLDWDVHGQSEVVSWYAIPRRSTVLALQGDTEIGRMVGDTRPSSIRALMDATLAAAGGS